LLTRRPIQIFQKFVEKKKHLKKCYLAHLNHVLESLTKVQEQRKLLAEKELSLSSGFQQSTTFLLR